MEGRLHNTDSQRRQKGGSKAYRVFSTASIKHTNPLSSKGWGQEVEDGEGKAKHQYGVRQGRSMRQTMQKLKDTSEEQSKKWNTLINNFRHRERL